MFYFNKTFVSEYLTPPSILLLLRMDSRIGFGYLLIKFIRYESRSVEVFGHMGVTIDTLILAHVRA